MDVNFELYKVFYHVARNLSFSDAATDLYISQSAVSQSVKQLEKKLSCTLFIRNTKRVRLTKEGEVLLRHVEQSYNLLKAGERCLERLTNVKRGEIRIGATDTICRYYLMPYIKKFSESNPGIKIHITNRTSPMLAELLKKDAIDIAVINVPHNWYFQNIEMRPLWKIRDVFIAGSRFKELRGKALTLSDLEDLPLLALEEGTVTRDYLDKIFRKEKIAKQPDVDLGSVAVLAQMAAINLGVAFVPYETAEEYLKKGEVFLLDIQYDFDKTPRHIGIALNANSPTGAATQAFIDILTEEA